MFSPLGIGIAAAGFIINAVIDTVTNKFSQIEGFGSQLGDQFSQSFSNVGEILSPAIERISESWSRLTAAFADNTALGQAINSIKEAVGTGFVAAFEAATQMVVSFVTTGIEMFSQILAAVMNILSAIVDVFAAIFNGDIPAILNTIPQLFATVFNAARAIVEAALSGIAATISSIVSSIASIPSLIHQVSSAAPKVTTGAVSGIGGHAEGGIFPRGAHLTWFAEESAEAAIPIDGSKRSISLWQRVGQMLGILPQQSTGILPQQKRPKQPTSILAPKSRLPFPLPPVIDRPPPVNAPPIIDRRRIPPLQKTPTLPPIAADRIPPTQPPVPAPPPLPPISQSPTPIKPPTPTFPPQQPPVQRQSPGNIILRQPPINYPSTIDRNRIPPINQPSIIAPKSRFPLLDQIQPFLHSTQSQSTGIISNQITRLESTSTSDVRTAMMPPITLHFHFEGNVNREDVRAGVEESVPIIRDEFERRMAIYNHERARRAF